jgi:hypothetical protein
MRERQAIKCKANRSSGGKCASWARPGQLVCATHGGLSPQAQEKALVRLEVRKFEIEGHDTADPGETLLMLISAYRARVIEVGKAIQVLVDKHDGDLEKALTADTWMSGDDGKSFKTGEHTKGLVDLETRLSSMLAGWCAVAVKANLEERRVIVQERNSAAFTDMMRLLINDRQLALTGAQRSEFTAAVARAVEQRSIAA